VESYLSYRKVKLCDDGIKLALIEYDDIACITLRDLAGWSLAVVVKRPKVDERTVDCQ
jgi:hypothetical protein